MEDFFISRRGQYLQTGSEFSGGNQTHLLHSDPGFEATIDVVPKGTVGCLYSRPIEDFEFNYLLRGKLELFGAKEKALLESGDTFTFYSLKRNYMFRALEDTEMLCIKKEPDYQEHEDFVNHLNEVLSHLQEADGDTLAHCERVKCLSMGIAYYLGYDPSKLLSLFYAAKFHDVGKAKIPLDILLKPGKLTAEEFEAMKAHSRYTYEMIRESGEFVINLTTESLAFATDYCGVRSGRDVDKWKETGLTRAPATVVSTPMIGESPVNIECRVTEIKELGSHHVFLAQVVAVHADQAYLNDKNKFDLSLAKPIVYSHGEYYSLGRALGTFGYSVKKPKKGKQ